MSKEQLVYMVAVYRTDGNHISILESPDYDKCFARWKELQEVWTKATKEQTPFVLVEPVVTAFAPAMVFEIKLIPVMSQQMAANAANNPYAQAMNEKGFSRSFPGAGTDLLSR